MISYNIPQTRIEEFSKKENVLRHSLLLHVVSNNCQVAIKFILNRQTFLSCLFLFFLSFFLSVPEPKGDYHHPPVSCTTIYKLLKTYRLHNDISVRHTEPKNRLKKCEILSICRKIRLFWRCLLLFFLALLFDFCSVFLWLFAWKRKQKNKSHAVTHSSWFSELEGSSFSFLFYFFPFASGWKILPLGDKTCSTETWKNLSHVFNGIITQKTLFEKPFSFCNL